MNMKTFLVKSSEYDDGTEHFYLYAEIWAAESKEQIWNEKHPSAPIGHVPNYEPKRESFPSEKIYNKHYRKYLQHKDEWEREYIANTQRELDENFIELHGVSNDESSLKMISKHLITSEVIDCG